MQSRTKKIVLSALVAGVLAFSMAMLAGCGCSRDKDGDDVKKTEKPTVVGSWTLTQCMDQNNKDIALDAQTKKECTIIIREDMSGSMSFTDGTYIGKFERTPESDMAYSEAWNQYTAQAYTFKTADGEIEIEFGFIVRNDGTQKPFIMLPIANVSYYYDK